MSYSKILLSPFIGLLSIASGFAQPLPRSTPEAEGISSAAIGRFVDATSKSKTEFHSFMLLRHGKVIAEGWWNPYRAELEHSLYSCSKSFTATAIGFAISEKLLSLDDKVISFFPNDLPDTVSEWLAELNVKDVLMMSDGQEPDPSFAVASKDTNWIKGFLATPIVHEPGSVFLYNSLGTYMLSAIVQKVTGQKTIDYLKPRLFDPLGITGMDWETDLKGINTGGWGLRLKTEDMAKFAELFLQGGEWNGKQILPASWVRKASTMKIMQDPNAPQSKKIPVTGCRAIATKCGDAGIMHFVVMVLLASFMIVMPDQDAVIAITAETPDMQEEINLIWEYLLPAFKKEKLKENTKALSDLKKQINNLALLPPSKASNAAPATPVKIFKASPNNLHLENIAFSFNNGVCKVEFDTDTGKYPVNFGNGKWILSETNMPGPSLTSIGIENTSMLYPAKIAGSYSWTDPGTLQLVLRYIESPHTETYTCHFTTNSVTIDAARSFDYGNQKTTVEAVAQ